MLELGIGVRDRVVVQLPNTPEFLYLTLALFRIGALPVMALPAHRETEIAYLVQHSQAKAYALPAAFRGFDYIPMGRALRAEARSLRYLLVTGSRAADLISIPELLAEPIEPSVPARRLGARGPDASEVALFLLSGGTTGMPKLIPRTHDDYAYNFRAAADLCGFGADTVYLVALPITHNFPLGCPGVLGTLHGGGKVVLAASPDPETALPLIERERVTATALVPALALRWMDAARRSHHDLGSLNLLQVGGARLNPEAARRVRPSLGCRLQQVFGMAEGLLNYTRLDDPEEVVLETQGRPLSPGDEIRIVDDADQPVPPGTSGHLLARGPYTVRGYFHADEHNARAFTPDGFYRTGDVVRRTPEGNLVVEGRQKDLINRGGEKISAEEVENLVLAHPKVFNVAVVAMPHPVLGEQACAYVIPRPGETLTLPELVAYLETQRIARFKLPERLELVERFPLTSVGKVSKKDLREDIARKLQAEGRLGVKPW